jgi:hypothetical protein
MRAPDASNVYMAYAGRRDAFTPSGETEAQRWQAVCVKDIAITNELVERYPYRLRDICST